MGSTSTSPPTTSPLETTTTSQTADVILADGEVNGPGRVKVSRGDTFSVTVLSDQEGEIHVHGYDIFFDMSPGAVVEVVFPADVAGIFEVEVEGPGLLLFEVEVAG